MADKKSVTEPTVNKLKEDGSPIEQPLNSTLIIQNLVGIYQVGFVCSAFKALIGQTPTRSRIHNSSIWLGLLVFKEAFSKISLIFSQR